MNKKAIPLTFFSLCLFACSPTNNESSSSIQDSSSSSSQVDDGDGNQYVNPVDEFNNEELANLETQSNEGALIYQSNRLKNAVQAKYSTDDRNDYVVSNSKMQFTHRLAASESSPSSSKLISSFKNSKGKDYFVNSFDAYVRSGEDVAYAKNSPSKIRINTTKLGYYYYETNVRDFDMSDFGYDVMLEKKFHTFSDDLRSQFRIVAQGTSSVDAIGVELKLVKTTVEKFEIFDGTSTTTSLTNSSYTGDKVQYIAFDIKDAGTFGLVFYGGAKVSLTDDGRHLILRQETINSAGKLIYGQDLEVYNRIYNDETHSFDGIKAANKLEQDPYTNKDISVDTSVDNASFVGYNPVRGVYQFHINGMNFNTSYYSTPDKKFYEKITVKNRDDRSVYFYVNSDYPLEASMVIDENEMQIPVPTQVMKNFGHENEEPIYETGDPFYGDVIIPYLARNGKTSKFSIVNVMQNWGNFPLKQLSSISYFISYYHLSTGVTETNCIAPYYSLSAYYNRFNYGWILPDFRGPSGEIWGADPQYNSVGIMCLPRFMERANLPNYQSAKINSSGLTYADIEYSYLLDDGDISFTLRHVETPQVDESRTKYRLSLDVLKDNTTLSPEDFSFFSCSSRNTNFRKYAYLNEKGEKAVIDSPKKESKAIHNLQNQKSYFTMYDKDNATLEDNNFGLLVSKSKLNGEDLPLAMYASYGELQKRQDYLALTTQEEMTLKKGDHIELDVILLPYGDEGKMEEVGDNIEKVYADSIIDPFKASNINGANNNDGPIIEVEAKDNVSDAYFVGGAMKDYSVNQTIKCTGFNKLAKPIIKKGTELKEYNYTKTVPFEGYTVSYENGKFDYSFVIKKENATERYQLSLANKQEIKI